HAADVVVVFVLAAPDEAAALVFTAGVGTEADAKIKVFERGLVHDGEVEGSAGLPGLERQDVGPGRGGGVGGDLPRSHLLAGVGLARDQAGGGLAGALLVEEPVGQRRRFLLGLDGLAADGVDGGLGDVVPDEEFDLDAGLAIFQAHFGADRLAASDRFLPGVDGSGQGEFGGIGGLLPLGGLFGLVVVEFFRFCADDVARDGVDFYRLVLAIDEEADVIVGGDLEPLQAGGDDLAASDLFLGGFDGLGQRDFRFAGGFLELGAGVGGSRLACACEQN